MRRVCLALVMLAALAVARAGPQLGPLSPGESADLGFAQVQGPRTFVFPQDHGPHPQFRQEWWYVTGNLDAADGERFGFELTIFRVALVPPGAAAAASASPWRTSEIYTAHFAVSDVTRGRLRSAQKWSRAALSLAGSQTEPFAVWLDDWSIRADPGKPDRWQLHASTAAYGLSLELGLLTPPVLNGQAGLSRKSSEPGSASYYYSLPRIAVHGELQREGRQISVAGLAWLDREWGSGNLGAHEVGWDWFGLQLMDGTALMFYSMRNADGSRDPASSGTWIESDGHFRELASGDVQLTASGRWDSPRGGRYPQHWRLQLPSQGLDLQISPVLADQELDTVPRYWEGAVDVNGTRQGRGITGRGYAELVGYAAAPPGKASR
jgi:predicted secreted hydrolase